MQQTCIVIDGNSLMHRAFHALPEMTTQAGVPTNAVYGFAGMLLKVLADVQPTHCAVAFDMHGPTFRHADYAEYKAGRKPTDEALRPQFPLVRRMLDAMGIRQLECPSFEADDILGTLAARGEAEGLRMLLITGDRDALQLVTERTHVLYTKRGITDTTEFDPPTVLEQYGVTPAQVPDLKGLMGDSSDNIPGVPGVGEKTAVKLLATYGTLESALDHADADQKGKLRERLLEHHDLALMCKKIATIVRDAPVEFTWEECKLGDLTSAAPFFREIESPSLIKRLPHAPGTPSPLQPQQPSMTWRPEIAIDDVPTLTRLIAEIPGGRVTLCRGVARATLASEAGARYRIELGGDLLTPGLDPTDVLLALRPLLYPPYALCVHDGKRLLADLDQASIDTRGARIHDDTLLAAYLLDPLQRSYALEALLPGQEIDAAVLHALISTQRQSLAEQEMLSLYEDIELPLLHVLRDMERAGFAVNRDELARMGAAFTAEIQRLTAEIYRTTGVEGFNLNSPKQLGEVLFDTLGLPAGRKTKSGWSTDAETLEGLAGVHPAITPLLEYRRLAKLQGTYIEGLFKLIDAKGRVHTWFDQTATSTGRISSNEPNLQNIPVRTPQGREIRRAFVAQSGWVLVDADYSQIELRILAHLSGDPGMTEAFRLGQDIHTRTAAEVYGVPMEQVTPAMRSASKAVNFGIVYGISDFGLARNLGISRKEAGDFIDRYFARYPGVRRYMDSAVAQGKALGISTTLLGRRRPLPELSSSNRNTANFGERAARNTPVQGTAADVIKLAMVRVADRLAASQLRARLILQVHDELIVECPADEAEPVSALLRECMEGALPLDVPLVADVHVGASWYDTK